MQFVFFLILSLFLLSCGKAAKEDDTLQSEEGTLDGVYLAIFLPINGKISYRLNGEVEISKFGDSFSVKIELKNAPTGIHKQYLRLGSRCPGPEADLNQDGIIDGNEAMNDMGRTLIPLDGDISSVALGNEFFPEGSYVYERSTSYSLMMTDLGLQQDLQLEKKIISISSETDAGEVPIACGVLTKISSSPDTEDTWGSRNPPPSGEVRPRLPSPSPTPIPEPVPEEHNEGWWERMRQRWHRWRDRARDWWRGRSGNGDSEGELYFEG